MVGWREREEMGEGVMSKGCGEVGREEKTWVDGVRRVNLRDA